MSWRRLLRVFTRTRQECDGLVEVGVHVHSEDAPVRAGRHVDDPQHVLEFGELRQHLRKQVRRTRQEALVEHRASLVWIEREVTDPRLHQILEEVRAEREVGHVVALLPGDLDQHRGVRYVGVRDAHTEPDVPAAAPASGTEQYEPLRRQQLIQLADCSGHCQHLLPARELGIAVGVHVHDVGDVGHPSVRDVPVSHEDRVFRTHVLRDRSRGRLVGSALRPALEEVEVGAVMRKLDVYRRAKPSLEKIQHVVQVLDERRPSRKTVERGDEVVRARIEQHPGRRLREASVLEHREHVLQLREVRPHLREHVVQLPGLQGPALEVDDINPAGRVADDLVDRDVCAQAGLPRNEERRVVVRHAVDRPCAEAWNQAHQSVLAPDSR